jgi:hypothetical protein
MRSPTQRNLFLLLAILPSLAFSAQEVDIPTTIQVFDASGKTSVATSTPTRASLPLSSAFVLPTICTTIIGTTPQESPFTTMSREHPLVTRIQSQRAILSSLIEELSFAPYLSVKDESVLGEHLRNMENEATVECLFVLASIVDGRDGKDRSGLVSRIDEVTQGLRYALTHETGGSPRVPTNAAEAMYAGDLLRLQYPTVDSLSITEYRVDLRISVRARLFGIFETPVPIRMTAEGSLRTMERPWWTALSSNTLDRMERDLRIIPGNGNGLAEMFHIAEAMLALIGS